MHTHTQHTHNTHTHNGHPFSFLLGWGCLFFAALGSCDPNCDDSTQKCCSSSRGNRPLDRRDGRPTNSANSRPGEKKKKKKKKNRKKRETFFDWGERVGRPSASAKTQLAPPHPHRNTILRSTGRSPGISHTSTVCLTRRLADLFIHLRLLSTAKAGHTLFLLFNYETFQKYQEEEERRSNFCPVHLFAGHHSRRVSPSSGCQKQLSLFLSSFETLVDGQQINQRNGMKSK